LTEGIILLDKPTGATSFQSLGSLKKRLGTGRVGHTGTLDRFAEGLLVVLAGRMTRLCPLASVLDKEYVAAISFGSETSTLDPEGEVVGTGPVPALRDIESAIPRFLGDIMQVPPAYSAVHVGGVRAYRAARKGDVVSLPPRPVRIDRLEVISYQAPVLVVRVSCSKGTYIRSLARDIAVAVGSRGFVSALRRTRVGRFRVEDAVAPDVFDPGRDVFPPALFFEAVPGLGRLEVKTGFALKMSRGGELSSACFQEPPGADGCFGAFASNGRLVAIIEMAEGRWRYAATFPMQEEEPRA
jgi:tRNA pseudouridine55 synthase